MTLRALRAALAVLAWLPASVSAQNPVSTLTAEILRQDSLAFSAFNRHDLDGALAFFAEDLEFLHDRDGALGHAELKEGLRSLFAQENGLPRELVPGSSEVHPVPGFGAIQIGRHRFCHDENGREDCGTFRFTHVWRQVDRRWEIARVLSYAHCSCAH